jgi:Protein kinase domain/Putative zinc-finger
VQCPDDPEIQAYLAGEATGTDQRALEEHLAGCAECRELVEVLRSTRSSARSEEPGGVATDTVPALHDAPTEDERRASLARHRDDSGVRSLRAGQLLAGRYEITHFLAAGGMGEVYEARDRELGELIAIKTVRRDESYVERLRRELSLARKVTHRNVCRVFGLEVDRSEGDEIVFLTMELLRGKPLSELLASGPIALEDAWWLAEGMIDGLAAAHSVGVLHRDFKSANVIAARRGRLALHRRSRRP